MARGGSARQLGRARRGAAASNRLFGAAAQDTDGALGARRQVRVNTKAVYTQQKFNLLREVRAAALYARRVLPPAAVRLRARIGFRSAAAARRQRRAAAPR